MKNLRVILTLFLTLAVICGSVQAQTKTRIKFAKGNSSATLNGKTTTEAIYVINGREGQTLSVKVIAADSTGIGLWAIEKDGGEEIGNGNGLEDWSGKLPATGDYTIMIGAGDGSGGKFTLKVSLK